MTGKKIKILSNNGDSSWIEKLAELLADLGDVSIEEESAFDKDPPEFFDLIVVDASGLQLELAERIARLNGRLRGEPIIVLTSSPTWRRARDVLHAGAADYMRRTTTDAELLARCLSLMKEPL